MSPEDPPDPSPAFTGGPFSGSFPEIDTRRSFLTSLVGMRIADRYDVVRILGEGGMGVVVEARHTELEQNVAIKFMFPEFLSNEVLNARFAREAKLAARVQSPHIVRVTDVGRLPSGVPYLVMDLLSGRDLGAELDEHGALPTEKAVDYILQAAAGIAALHALGVVHRDLKPSNLFVADVAGVPTVKVLDFGISKDITTPSASITSTETQLGTPMYMSPEQIRASKNVDTRSDIWSLGVILYELLTGTLPFERSGHSVGELFAVILMTEPTPLCMRRPELPESLEQVVMRCLRRNSWDRYEDVAAFAEALRPFTRASSIHRIDAVRRALGDAVHSAEVASKDVATERVIAGNLPTVSASGASAPAASNVSEPAAAPSGLDAPIPDVELEVDYATPATRAAEAERLKPDSLSSSFAASSYSPPRPLAPRPRPARSASSVSDASEGSRRAGVYWALGGAAALIGAAATFAVRASTAAPVVPEPTLAAPPPPVVPEPSEAPPLPSDGPPPSHGSAGLEAPSARVPARASPPTAPPRSIAPVRTAAPPAASGRASVRTEDLIMDRK